LYCLLLKYLETMNSLSATRKSEKQDIVTAGFLIKLLDGLGYRIEAEKCVKCGEKLKLNNNYFSAERGGILCEKCEKQIIRKVKIGHNAIKLIRLFLANKIENFSKIEVEKGSMTNLKAIIREEMNWIIG
jgi:DNA repair protein RecO (recombination protein O)